MFRLVLTARAKKELKQLSKRHALVISEIIDEIKEDPFIGKPLSRELTGRMSFKVGVYRIVYKINTKDKTVLVITAGHRGVVYT